MPRGIDTWSDEREAARQREADRLASEANPPIRIPIPPEGCTVILTSRNLSELDAATCSLGTPGCHKKHDGTDPPELTYAEQLKAWNERVRAGETKSHFTGD